MTNEQRGVISIGSEISFAQGQLLAILKIQKELIGQQRWTNTYLNGLDVEIKKLETEIEQLKKEMEDAKSV